MRGALRLSLCAFGLGLGLVGACFKEDFLLGAVCRRDSDCGDDQCCSGRRCRPAPCTRGENEDTSYEHAYTACERDEDCLMYGMPRCVHRPGAVVGFCADLCFGVPGNCEAHPESDSRTCLDLDGQQLCALSCCAADCEGDPAALPGPCPEHMECLDDVCVPKKKS